MELVRFFTAGNVDDGKSTLIGRLLYDSKSVSTDIIETLTRQSKTKGADTQIDLALLTDGLRAEREQGITIDVAYKYFSTPKRKFIIADTPGHIQYTRNMFTGASNADVAIILIDVRNGITEQTRRHSILASILRIQHVLVCVNKMDLVNYSKELFEEIVNEYNEFAKELNLQHRYFIPASALAGDNVVEKSNNMLWYQGKSLLEYLETVKIETNTGNKPARFQVQYVIRPQTKELHDYRGYAGKILSGEYHKGDKVIVLPANLETEIAKIEKNQQEVDVAFEEDSVVIHLKDDIDVGRGSSIVKVNQLPFFEKETNAIICWMDTSEAFIGKKYILQQNSFTSKVALKSVNCKIDIQTNEKQDLTGSLRLNDIAEIGLKAAENITYDRYADNKNSGAFILIDEATHATVAAGTFY